MNDLVKLMTQDVSNAIPVTDTIIISEKFNVTNLSVVKLIEKYKDDFEDLEKLTSFEMTRELKQRTERAYLLNEEQFYLLVTYMKNTEIARKYKKEFVKQFSFMKKELMARAETRHIVKANRKLLTDTIKNVIPEGNFKNYAYGNYTRLIYKKLFGKTVKELKEIFKVKEGGNLRDYFTLEQLEKIQEIESHIASIIEYDKTNDEKIVYEKVKDYLKDKKIV